MLPSPKKCVHMSPGGTHQASPLACCIGPGGQNLARACPGASLCGFCSCLLVPANLLHLGLGLSRFQPPRAFWWIFANFGQLACFGSEPLGPKAGWPQSWLALKVGGICHCPHPKPTPTAKPATVQHGCQNAIFLNFECWDSWSHPHCMHDGAFVNIAVNF